MSWREVRDQGAPAAERPGPAFRDAHAALAFTAGGDVEARDKLLGRLRDEALKGNLLAREITLPLVQGVDAFAQGQYDRAVELLEPVFPQLARIGGSHAQREVFEDTLLEAYLRDEQFDKAEDMLRGQVPTDELIEEAARCAYKPALAMDNTDYEAHWRKKMAPIFVARTLRDCLTES